MRVRRLLTLMLFSSIWLFAAESPFSGTWKLNPAKGHPIQPLPRSAMAHIEVDGDNFSFSQEYVDYRGQTTNVSYRAKFDGKEYPVICDPNHDSVSLRQVNKRKISFTFKKAGNVTLTIDATVSNDGETTTLSYTDYTGGKPPHNGSAVYERQ